MLVVRDNRKEDDDMVINRPERTKKDHSQDRRKGDSLDRKRRNNYKRSLDELEEEDLEDEMYDYT